jgi:putative ABC transport system permease protein
MSLDGSRGGFQVGGGSIPLSYIARNLWVRRVTTLLTAVGMGLVVYVFATVLMMSEGIHDTLVATGSVDNVIALRKGAGAEINSGIGREQAAIIDSLPEIATDGQGHRLITREVVVLNTLPKRSNGKPSNVAIRGTSAQGFALRPQIKLVAGRMFRPGTSEVISGQAVARGFAHAGLGDTLRFGSREWRVVGVFDGARSGFDSEIWGDGEQMMQAFRRLEFSVAVFKLADPSLFDRVRHQLEADPRLSLDAKVETVFYAEQSEMITLFIRLLGLTLSIIFSIGAIVGAMITMFASVASRINEIGTLRALGFRRSAILKAFMIESLLLSLVGGVLGMAGAALMQTVQISTMNFQSFAELAFRFTLTPTIALQSLSFALIMGLVGGFIPAWRAARLTIIDCLRQA